MRELNEFEVEQISGAVNLYNGGDWGTTLTLTALGAIGGSKFPGGIGTAVGAALGFFSSFKYQWDTPGITVNGVSIIGG